MLVRFRAVVTSSSRSLAGNSKVSARLYDGVGDSRLSRHRMEVPNFVRRAAKLLSIVALLALLLPALLPAQDEPNLDAKQRLFAEVGAGFRAIRRGPSGRYYVLTAPGAAVLIFDSSGKKIAQVPAQSSGSAAINFGAALDVDAAGQVYVADRGGNAVKVYAPDGSLAERIAVAEPIGVAVLPDGEIAVAAMKSDSLITVYDKQGQVVRSFGEREDLAASVDLNRLLNFGYLISDAAGNLYYAFEYMPEPTVRKYDRAGYLSGDFSLSTPDLEGMSQSARREIARASSGAVISPHEIVSAIGVDSAAQEIWLALGDMLLRVSPAGDILSTVRTYSPSGARIESRYILVEPDRLLLGSDPLGVFPVVPKDWHAPAR